MSRVIMQLKWNSKQFIWKFCKFVEKFNEFCIIYHSKLKKLISKKTQKLNFYLFWQSNICKKRPKITFCKLKGVLVMKYIKFNPGSFCPIIKFLKFHPTFVHNFFMWKNFDIDKKSSESTHEKLLKMNSNQYSI